MASLRAHSSYEPANGSRQPQSAFGLLKLVSGMMLFIGWLPLAVAIPLSQQPGQIRYLLTGEDLLKSAEDPSLWAYLGTAAALVLLGGAFAGLTIALMGQDEIYLQVIATSGEGAEKDNARKVLNLLKKGKHWVLVTLLLGNVITNETLPIVLDRSLGGGWPAVLGSTVLIVIFGEIAPQSVCVRYGLPIGAFMAPFVLILMWLLSPVAWPTAKLLDYILGEDHGTTYKKAGLKTLVTLHRTLGTAAEERLNKDEVTIISAVLDLKEKTVGRIMTPMQDVFTLSADTVLDEEMTSRILAEGYSRIPIHAVERETDFIGMLLVKMLITYDPEDCLKVRDFPLATLPETRPETSCLDIINFFQEGKSHMILVSEYPGESTGALGVVTLEDVIEELIGEEIIDESDVFIDVHKAIRRLQPAPRFRVPKGEIVEQRTGPDPAAGVTSGHGMVSDPAKASSKPSEDSISNAKNGAVPSPPGSRKASISEIEPRSPTAATYFMRRRSSGTNEPTAVRSTAPELRQHLRHLGPSNAASRPKPTHIKSVKIKPGINQLITLPEMRQLPADGGKAPSRAQSMIEPAAETNDERTSLLSRVSEPMAIGDPEQQKLLSAGREASDAVHAVSYGTLSTSPTAKTKDLPSLARMVPSIHSPAGSSQSKLQNSTSPPLERSSRGATPATYPPALLNTDSQEGRESQVPGDKSAHQGEVKDTMEEHRKTFENPSSDPSTSATRIEIQQDSRGLRTQIRPSAGAEAHPITEEPRDSENGAFDGPQKLVIELERQTSHISEISEHESGDTLGSLHSFSPDANSPNGSVTKQPLQARSGSITEQIIDVGGLKKVVLEAQPSSSDDEQNSQEGARSGGSPTKQNSKGGKGKGKDHANGAPKLNADGSVGKEAPDGDDAEMVLSSTNVDPQKKKKRHKRGKKKPKNKKIGENAAPTGTEAS